MATFPVLDPLDRRLNACSAQLADIRLKGRCDSEKYVSGVAAQIIDTCVDLHSRPDATAGVDAQLLFGQTVKLFDEQSGYCWVQSDQDGYVGWVTKTSVSKEPFEPTHRVIVGRTFVYPQPDIKEPKTGALSMGSVVKVVDLTQVRGTEYAILMSGEAVISRHICPIDEYQEDYVSVAESLLGTPYLWGGSSAFGLDCSGLVQLSSAMAGNNVLRDSDMLAATFGEPVDPGGKFKNLQRGDLVLWRGHVGIIQGGGKMIHANGHTMNTISEPLAEAVDRIAYLYEKPIGFRRA